MVTQVLFIHGGTTFFRYEDYINYLKTKSVRLEEKSGWNHGYLEEALGEDFFVIKPRMPCRENAKYEEWKILFERYVELLDSEVVLVGFSLGGIFLAKYLSENKISKKVISLNLVAPPFDGSLPDEELAGGFDLGEDLGMVVENCSRVRLFFNRDDFVIPVSHAEKYRSKLPEAEIIIYDDKEGHFFDSEFPEIVEMIKSDV